VPGFDRWLDRQAGPVVRPYALTGGRTAPAGDTVLDLITVVVASGQRAGRARSSALGPEHRGMLRLCQEPVTVADLAADLDLPLGVVRVLLSDLIQEKLISVQPRPTARPQASYNLLQEVLDGLRAL
jgi:hypothetical protein